MTPPSDTGKTRQRQAWPFGPQKPVPPLAFAGVFSVQALGAAAGRAVISAPLWWGVSSGQRIPEELPLGGGQNASSQ